MIHGLGRGSLILGAFVVIAATTGGRAATATVPAQRDGTLIQSTNGTLANGAGPSIFAGRTAAENGVRRGLLRFDLPTAPSTKRLVPSVIESATVVLTDTTESNIDEREYRLHRLLADWGEGASSSAGGAARPRRRGTRRGTRHLLPRCVLDAQRRTVRGRAQRAPDRRRDGSLPLRGRGPATRRQVVGARARKQLRLDPSSATRPGPRRLAPSQAASIPSRPSARCSSGATAAARSAFHPER